MKKPPPEIVASLLAISTVLMSLPPLSLPGWATFIGWAGTFAMGGPTRENMMKIWRTMLVGACFAFLVVLGFEKASYYVSGAPFVLTQMGVLFVLNTTMLYTARVQPLSFVPGMFFGFASYFAMYYGGFGPAPHNEVVSLLVVAVMNALGPVFAWLNVNCAAQPREEG